MITYGTLFEQAVANIIRVLEEKKARSARLARKYLKSHQGLVYVEIINNHGKENVTGS